MEDPIDKTIDEILSCLGDEFVFEGEENIITKHVLMFRFRPFTGVSKNYVGYPFINDSKLFTRLNDVKKLHNIKHAIYSSGLINVVLDNRSSSEYILK